MKANIQNIEKTICKFYNKAQIVNYYVEDTKTAYQKIVVYGQCEDMYFFGSIIGYTQNESEIMKQINITSNKFAAKYMFTKLM